MAHTDEDTVVIEITRREAKAILGYGGRWIAPDDDMYMRRACEKITAHLTRRDK